MDYKLGIISRLLNKIAKSKVMGAVQKLAECLVSLACVTKHDK